MLTKCTILTNILLTPTLKHPMTMGSMMIIQTTLMCLNQSSIMKSPWYLYIMFLTMVGGLMIMFMYMSSIASNEKFKPSMKLLMIWMMTLMMTISIYKIDSTKETIFKMNEMKYMMTEMAEEKSTSKFFSMFKMNITITMMMILIITMISVTNIASTFEGPLKKTYV
uniref:NADH-ubiquinone oxidoreductase chain 6 n=1 Tax=Aphaena discolor nigrotibiata TaxID=2608304 RepID=A0A5C2FU48_9HEMI|nr:NADH dehydrogenase subunit 6 [Aphaena discolor nigrotibiata]